MATKPPSEGLKIKGNSKRSSEWAEGAMKKRKKARGRKRRPEAPSNGASEEEFEAILRDLAEARDGSPHISERDDFDDAGLGNDLKFEGADDLASPEAGPSRLPMTPSGTSFTPLPRSVLSGFAKRPDFSPERSTSPPRTLEVEKAADENGHTDPTGEQTSEGDTLVSPHFDPPGLFSTSIDTVLKSQTAAVALPSTPSSGAEPAQAESSSRRGLLLPDNIIVDGLGESESAKGQSGDVEGSSMEGLHFVDDNISKGAQRYFVAEQTEEDAFLASADQSKICQNCKKPGHRQKDCPHVICTVCGAMDEHERRDCPHGITCFGCGQRGHRQSDCPDPVSRHSRKRGCDRCGSRDHPESACPTIWRIYRYYSATERTEFQEKKRKATEWAREALGDVVAEMFCYNCAKSGHLGDDCPRPRASPAKLFNPTAFSHFMARRGPYFASRAMKPMNNSSPATHTRFDDDASLPGTAPGFGGSDAGRKTRDKARKSMIDREAGARSESEEDWFSSRSNFVSTPDNRGRGMSIRGRGGKMNGTPQNRPWDSDSRPTQGRSDPAREMPFGHSHLMASAPASVRGKGISFKEFTGDTVDSPTAAKGKGKKLGNPAKNMLERAIKGSHREQSSPNLSQQSRSNTPSKQSSPLSSPAPSNASSTDSTKKKRRRKNKEDDDDLESTWWSSGKAGGNVSEWGKDMPKHASGKKQAAKGNKGQQYMGGY